MMKEYYKHPRLYLKDPIAKNMELPLSADQVHYLKNVLRKGAGDFVRLFNGKDGEWIARISGLEKKGGLAKAESQLRAQGAVTQRIHLFFAPIRKQRLDILIEKAVELGVSEFHPVITRRTENRKLNMERLNAQIFEAAEQCERLELPILHEAADLPRVIRATRPYPVFACLERDGASPLSARHFGAEFGFLIGPEGGFDDDEIAMIRASGAQSVSLGEAVLRAETAAIACLSYAKLSAAEA